MKFFKFLEEKWQMILTGMLVVVIFLSVLLLISVKNNEKNNLPDESELLEQLLVESEETKKEEENSERIAQAHKEEKEEHSIVEIIVVDVKGAVKNPGVYQMAKNQRVIDAVQEAGGFLAKADQNLINLAQLLSDQMVIYIPEEGEELTSISDSLVTNPSPTESDSTASKKVNLNTASQDELQTLHGIGSSKAQSIISYREENGSFQSIEDIKNVSGIGEATFEKLKDFIEVSP